MSNNYLLMLFIKHFSWLRTFTTNANAYFFYNPGSSKLELMEKE